MAPIIIRIVEITVKVGAVSPTNICRGQSPSFHTGDTGEVVLFSRRLLSESQTTQVVEAHAKLPMTTAPSC